MEGIKALGTASKPTKERINAMRLYLRVTTILDLANKAGTHIPDEMMCG